jgi:hypothetical protein
MEGAGGKVMPTANRDTTVSLLFSIHVIVHNCLERSCEFLIQVCNIFNAC